MHGAGLTADEGHEGVPALIGLGVLAWSKLARFWNGIAGSFVGTHTGLQPVKDPLLEIRKRLVGLPQESSTTETGATAATQETAATQANSTIAEESVAW